jgi:hypothetical protein
MAKALVCDGELTVISQSGGSVESVCSGDWLTVDYTTSHILTYADFEIIRVNIVIVLLTAFFWRQIIKQVNNRH